jgi:creatinine amidohydrolase
MRLLTRIVFFAAFSVLTAFNAAAQNKGVLLADLTWQQAEKVLTSATVVVIPLGAESKEHGPHLKLNADYAQAEYFKKEVIKNENVVVAPTLNYGYYPAFTDYPGSVSLSIETSRDTVVEICRALAKFGPHRFYILNMGISTIVPLQQARDVLSREGIILAYTGQENTYLNTLSTKPAAEPAQRKAATEGEIVGTHAHEWETSVLLFIDPENVDMSKAVKDYHPSNLPGLRKFTRDANTPGTYSSSGVFGDATLATKEKGAKFVGDDLRHILNDIETLKKLGSHE